MPIDGELKAHLESVQQATLAALEGLKGEWKLKYEELKSQGANAKDITEQVERALKRLDTVEALVKQPVSQGNAYTDISVGQRVVESEGIKDFIATMKASSGKSGYSTHQEFRVPMQSLFIQPEAKTTITSSAVGSSTPGILIPERIPGIVKPGIRKVRARDLLPRFPTTSNAIEFVKENVATNNASPQTEASAKGESAVTFTIDYENVKTIATWIPATRQVLDDFQQLQAYIDQRLVELLKDQEDEQILRGDGAGSHLAGMVVNSGSYSTSRNVSGDTYIDQLNHAISQIEDVNLTATGIILHPRDWRKIQLYKQEQGGANKGSYLLGGPSGEAEPMLWGLPVATTTAMGVGNFFVGAFLTHAAIWDRMDARVDIATQHDVYFTQNMIAIRAEERLALTIYRNDAVLYGSFA